MKTKNNFFQWNLQRKKVLEALIRIAILIVFIAIGISNLVQEDPRTSLPIALAIFAVIIVVIGLFPWKELKPYLSSRLLVEKVHMWEKELASLDPLEAELLTKAHRELTVFKELIVDKTAAGRIIAMLLSEKYWERIYIGENGHQPAGVL